MANTGKSVILALVLAGTFVLILNLGFSILAERPDFPNVPCENKLDGTCGEAYQAAQAQWEEANDKYERNLFFFSLAVGVFLVVAGAIVPNKALSWALMIAGAVQLIYGSASYWGNINKYLKLAMLVVAAGILAWTAMKRKW